MYLKNGSNGLKSWEAALNIARVILFYWGQIYWFKLYLKEIEIDCIKSIIVSF